jgi:hypothetical protein
LQRQHHAAIEQFSRLSGKNFTKKETRKTPNKTNEQASSTTERLLSLLEAWFSLDCISHLIS